MEEKKKYTNPQIETIMIELGDVVTSSEHEDPEPPVDQDTTEEVY